MNHRFLAWVIGVALVVVATRPWCRRVRVDPRRRPAVAGPRATTLVRSPLFRPAVVVLAAVAGLVVSGPTAALAAAGSGALIVPLAARVERRRERAAVAAAVPDLVDLFLVSASAGQPVAGSLAVVDARSPPAVAAAVAEAHGRFRRGLPLDECLEGLGLELGTTGVALTDALRQAASTGVPLVPLLSAVAAAARDGRRRRSQEVARRLPVTMLFPLVACILPAAVALAVVPVLLVSVSSLSP